MDCPNCQAPGSSVKQSMDDGVTVSRLRLCPCGTRWRTEETVIRASVRTLAATNGTGRDRPPPVSRNQPPAGSNDSGGFGGDLPSGSDLPPSPDPPSDLDLTRSDQARASARVNEPVYPVAFEEVWIGTGRLGGKHLALKAWKKMGSPSWATIRPIWESYLRSPRPASGFVKDLSSWFNGRFHQQEWLPAAPAPEPGGAAGIRTQQTAQTVQRFMQRHGGG